MVEAKPHPSSAEFPWKGVLIRIENEYATGLNYSVPGWECIHCGARYGSSVPPSKCWKCQGDENVISVVI